MRAFLAGAFAVAAMMVAPGVAGAATISVNTTADEYSSGPDCSLREAITAAQTNAAFGGCSAGSGTDSILLPGGDYVITRAGADEDANVTGDFDVTGANNLEIRPSAPTDRVTIDGNSLDRVFDKGGVGTLSIKAVRVLGGKLTLIEDGGGIRVLTGLAELENVTIDGNETAYQGGGVAVYDAFSMINSTVSGNKAGGHGGGLYGAGGSTMSARSSTIVSNQADSDGDTNGYGGGFAESGATSVNFVNVLNGGNSAATPPAPAKANDCYSGPFFFPRYTLQTQTIGPNFCLVGFNPGNNVVTEDAMYGPLGYHGGQTPTHNLLEGSPAIGAGGTAPPDECPGIDQNGIGRLAGSCDIGSTTYIPVPKVAKLKITKVLPKKKVIRRKKAKPITVVVRNTGTAAATGARVCLKLNKAARKGLKIKGKACKKPGGIAVGAVKRVKIRLAAKPKAKKKAYPVVVTAKAANLKLLKRKFKVRVK